MYKQILELINSLPSNMLTTSREILEDLQGLRDEIEMLIEATEADIKKNDEQLGD